MVYSIEFETHGDMVIARAFVDAHYTTGQGKGTEAALLMLVERLSLRLRELELAAEATLAMARKYDR